MVFVSSRDLFFSVISLDVLGTKSRSSWEVISWKRMFRSRRAQRQSGPWLPDSTFRITRCLTMSICIASRSGELALPVIG